MEPPAGRAQNPYEQAAERMREQDRAGGRAFATAPLGPFLLRTLAWGLVGAVIGYLLGGWFWALVMFLGWGPSTLLIRWWARQRYVNRRTEPRSQP